MSIDKSNDENTPTDTEGYYETVASQEEIYLEDTEEELRMMLTSDEIGLHYEQVNVARSMTDANNNASTDDDLDEKLGHAVEELIIGDSDDPPVSEEAVVEMLRVSLNVRRPGPI